MGLSSAQSHSHTKVVLSLLVLALGTFMLGLTEFSMMPMLPLVAQSFDVATGRAGEAISAYALGVVVGAPLLMILTTKLKRRTALVLYAFLIFLFNGLSAYSQSFSQLILFRFLSGIPHGAYFGTALLFGAKLAPEGRNTLFMSRVFFGLTIATIIGVPVATLIAQLLSWRLCLIVVALIAFICCGLLRQVLPDIQVSQGSLRQELAVLKDPLIWPIVGIVVVGFGGVFCIYTYLANTILNVTHISGYFISIAMVLFGIGSTAGNWLLGKPHDRFAERVTGGALVYSVLVALAYVKAAQYPILLFAVVFLLGACLGLTTVIQSMLMQVAKGGHEVIGALLQCAFNTANAIGPIVGSVVFSYHHPANQTGYIAALLFAGGLLMWWLSGIQRRHYAYK
ncbi:MFS transporter [Celerinatantimonas diazotrophica]|uniref:DHA1 family inner membrane transport protein n=1 Tax=Celerinatantimonas diazotrophica TaxID=412034 RepID=A0A4R1J968_9GAMM|nr:MFS transporter [Celerinatantimonas diazotrophica]TCK47153.1 DHA1 family inner membrane transport protein [Celerinatantimonas diazotrophica]CAG9295925.1 sugar efflux transporter [Celerinatantimonas diazotrophica]